MTAWPHVERAASRKRGQARGVEAARRATGAASGWYSRPDARLDSFSASRVASRLEGLGWRAEAFLIGQGIATVEVRDLGTRGMPLVSVLRYPQEARACLDGARLLAALLGPAGRPSGGPAPGAAGGTWTAGRAEGGGTPYPS